LEGRRIAFLARHGLGHRLSPSEVNYRANIYALKSLGVQRIVSISACGSLRDDYAPGHIAVPDQLFDFTKDRRRSFFSDGLVVHISTADPFCKQLSAQLVEAIQPTGASVHDKGAMITIEGPRFSTRAESNAFRQWGMTLIGMTTSPEAFLAREAEMCYAVMAHVTDYDVWHISEQPVTVEQVVAILNANTRVAQQAILNLLRALPDDRTCDCEHALKDALMTTKDSVPAEVKERLGLLVGKYF
jgi:5'-methylthioadenosine phosphorylase